jgi:hypothetical protein
MKKLFFVALILSSGCSYVQNNQQRAESLVKKHLDSVLNDPHSYEGVSFGKLDTSKTFFANTQEWDIIEQKKLKTEVDLSIERVHERYPTLYNHNKELEKIKKLVLDSVNYGTEMEKAEKAFKSEQDGWYIKHVYRAKNGFGALGLHTTTFKINIDMNKVVNDSEEK